MYQLVVPNPEIIMMSSPSYPCVLFIALGINGILDDKVEMAYGWVDMKWYNEFLKMSNVLLSTKCICTLWLRDLVWGHCRDQSCRQVLCGDLGSSEQWLSIGWLHHPSYLPKQDDDKPKFIPQVSNTWQHPPPPPSDKLYLVLPQRPQLGYPTNQ